MKSGEGSCIELLKGIKGGGAPPYVCLHCTHGHGRTTRLFLRMVGGVLFCG